MPEDPFWRYVREMYDRMDSSPPAGLAPVVDVRLRTGESFRPGHVQPYPPWLTFEYNDEKGNRAVVIVPEEMIDRIDLRFVLAEEHPIGFTVKSRDEPVGE